MRPASHLSTGGVRIAAARSSEAGWRVVVAVEIGVLPVPGLAWADFGPEGVCRLVSRFLLGHCFGAKPAPGGSSLFCFDWPPQQVKSGPVGAPSTSPCGLRFPLGILFAKCGEKIPPEPP